MDPTETEAVEKWPTLINMNNINVTPFLGLASYYRQHIPSWLFDSGCVKTSQTQSTKAHGSLVDTEQFPSNFIFVCRLPTQLYFLYRGGCRGRPGGGVGGGAAPGGAPGGGGEGVGVGREGCKLCCWYDVW